GRSSGCVPRTRGNWSHPLSTHAGPSWGWRPRMREMGRTIYRSFAVPAGTGVRAYGKWVAPFYRSFAVPAGTGVRAYGKWVAPFIDRSVPAGTDLRARGKSVAPFMDRSQS